MGKGGCKSTPAAGVAAPAKEEENAGGSISTVLEKERQQKIDAEPKFYWARDEEPHRRR